MAKNIFEKPLFKYVKALVHVPFVLCINKEKIGDFLNYSFADFHKYLDFFSKLQNVCVIVEA